MTEATARDRLRGSARGGEPPADDARNSPRDRVPYPCAKRRARRSHPFERRDASTQAPFAGKNIVLPSDGNGEFRRLMGMPVQRSRQGMGLRNWCCSMHVTDGTVRRIFAGPGFRGDPPGVGLSVADPRTMLNDLTEPAASMVARDR